MSDTIETEAQFRHTLRRAAALRDHCAALRAVQALAIANHYLGTVEPEDLRDLVALDDILGDVSYALRCLEGALTDWETSHSHGAGNDDAADRAWHRRRSL